MNTFERIWNVVKDIPRGKVATYGQIAYLLGNPHLSQIVGYALHQNPNPNEIPCHRVVNRFGRVSSAFAFGGEGKQRKLLEAEGIKFSADGTIDLEIYQWKPSLDF